jgi:hypothetical protein
MKTSPPTRRTGALTLIEVLVILAVLSVLAAIFLPPLASSPVRAPRIQCVNNLKQVGLSFRVWEGDNLDKYPMATSETNGGTMEFITGPNAWRHFQVMSNELSTPKVLLCPAESDDNRFLAKNFVNFNNSNISFFVGIVPNETNATMILSGDHNITNGAPVRNGLLELTTGKPAGWTAEMHNKVGNILLNDGSVQQVSIAGLCSIISNSGAFTNRLQMPILNP